MVESSQRRLHVLGHPRRRAGGIPRWRELSCHPGQPLGDGEARDEQTRSEVYNVIQGEANRLSRLIDNILNLSFGMLGINSALVVRRFPNG